MPSFWLLRDEMMLLFRGLHILNYVVHMSGKLTADKLLMAKASCLEVSFLTPGSIACARKRFNLVNGVKKELSLLGAVWRGLVPGLNLQDQLCLLTTCKEFWAGHLAIQNTIMQS